MRRRGAHKLRVLVLLGLLPLLAHAPAWWHDQLLGPNDGAALHLPLRAAAWASLERGEVPSWNPSIFGGAPLLASYRAGAFYPPMAALCGLHPFTAFQLLVLGSLGASAMLVFAYVRRLGGGLMGAYVSGLCFSLGPYLVGHLGDTATIVASPLLPLALIAAESHMNRASPGRAAGLAAAIALLLLAGSPEAAQAGGALVAGRLAVGHLLTPKGRGPSLGLSLLALTLGLALAAPQALPTLLAAPGAGRQVTDLASTGASGPPGLTGLILRYVSHTPAAPLALAALPLAATQMPVRALGVALALCLALQWGRGPLAAPGALALVFDLTLASVAGLALSTLWQTRLQAAGGRLRGYFLFACLSAAAALAVSAAAIGPLPETLAGAVGVLALSLILYFSFATHPDPVVAGVWLLPLTVSFLLQPHARQVWRSAPTRAQLFEGTATRTAIDRIMGQRRSERVLTLTRQWPYGEELDLAYAGLGVLTGRKNANGYDPMVPLRTRQAYQGMGPAGTLLGAFFRGAASLPESLAVRWIQVPASVLRARGDRFGLGDTLDIVLEARRPRLFPLPITALTEVRLGTWLADAVGFPDGEPVARVEVRLMSGRVLSWLLRAGRHTAEWAYDRPDVRPVVAHRRAPILESWPDLDGGFQGHRYVATLRLPGRYTVDAVFIERLPGPGRLTLGRLGVFDAATGLATPVSQVAGYVSDTTRFREAAATPTVWVFELPNAREYCRVVAGVQVVADDEVVLAALAGRAPTGLDPKTQALITAADAQRLELPPGGRASRAQLVQGRGGRLGLRAAGPGLLVVAESWDPGWSATVDAAPAEVVRVNHVQIGIPLGPGLHMIRLRHRPRGLDTGLAACGLALAVMAIAQLRSRRRAG